MGTICLQCGNEGYDNAFVFCVKCLEYAVHRYCLDVIPESFDEFVHWVCDDCEDKLQNRTVSTRKYYEKDGTVSIETEEHVYEDFPHHLYDAYTKFDSVERPKAPNESSPEEFFGLNSKENEKFKQNPTQQLDQGQDEHNKVQRAISGLFTLEANMKKKRSKIMRRDNGNTSKKPRVECKNINASKPIKLLGGDPVSCEVKEKKISEPGIMENPILSCNISSKSSKKKTKKKKTTKRKKKKKTLVSLEVNLKENHENNGVELENHRAGCRTEGGAIRTSDGHEENAGLKVGNEFPKDTNMLDCSTCAEPIVTPIWSGRFNMSGKRHDILDGLKGHVSSKACQKVYEEISLFQTDLHLTMLPLSDVWPKSFELSDPSEENIALFFFPSEISEPEYDQLIGEMSDRDLALKGFVHNAEILIFTSMVLPLMYWRFNNKYYLWGVFRARKLPRIGSQINA